MESTAPLMKSTHAVGHRLLWVAVFSVAFAFVEASVVVYLRALYYPEGFAFPLKLIVHQHLVVELVREAATIVMLIAVGWIAGRSVWERFAYFLISFGTWDVFFYIWLKATLGWPASMTDWDILFLLPAPWISPVIAPVLISTFMVCAGVAIALRIARDAHFRPNFWSWILALSGTAVLLWSFMRDADAALGESLPRPYRYELLVAGLVLYGAAFFAACKRDRTASA
jgi:hypothetical protein